MENGDSLYARIAELEKENEKLKEEKSVLMAVAAGNYNRGKEFRAICRKYFTAEYIDSCVRAMDAALVSEYFRDTEEEDNLLNLLVKAWTNDEEEEEEEVLEDLTCDQLKTRLRAINKPVGGRKADLIQRIREHERLTAALFEED
jgi:hypothetical protein